MKQNTILKLTLLLSVLLLSTPYLSAEYQSQAKPRVVILATGGTIAGSAQSSSAASYQPGVLSIEQIISSVPDIDDLAQLKGIQLSNISSQNITEEIWLQLWKTIDNLFSYDLCDGVVITHGTDTMEETAYFLNLTVRHTQPVVITGAMRPATSLSADGPFNLYNAVALAASKNAHNRGVMVVMNDMIFSADDVSKTHTVNTSAFSCPNYGPLGHIRDGVPVFYRESPFRHTASSEFDLKHIESLPKTEVVLLYAFSSATAINALIGESVKGIVIAGVGHGNYNRDVAKSLEKAFANGIPVVRSSRIITGGVDLAAEEYDSRWPVAYNKSPQKARILLMLSLLRTNDIKEIQRIFKEY